MAGFIILVAGAPGTGKSSVGIRLAWLLDCGFLESSDLLAGAGAAKRDPSGRATLLINEDAARNTIRKLVDRIGKCLVVASPTPLLWIEAVDDSVAFVVLLRSRPEIVFQRLTERGWPRDKVVENTLAEAFGEYADPLSEFDAVVEVDTSDLSPGEAVEEVVARVREWRVGVRIDWMSLPEVQEFISSLLARYNPSEDRLLKAWGLDQGDPGRQPG